MIIVRLKSEDMSNPTSLGAVYRGTNFNFLMNIVDFLTFPNIDSYYNLLKSEIEFYLGWLSSGDKFELFVQNFFAHKGNYKFEGNSPIYIIFLRINKSLKRVLGQNYLHPNH